MIESQNITPMFMKKSDSQEQAMSNTNYQNPMHIRNDYPFNSAHMINKALNISEASMKSSPNKFKIEIYNDSQVSQ